MIPPRRSRPGQSSAIQGNGTSTSLEDIPQATTSDEGDAFHLLSETRLSLESHLSESTPSIQRQALYHEPVAGNLVHDESVPADDVPGEMALGEPITGELVDTEIGPLPSDLWRLIGQSPPETVTTAAPEPESETVTSGKSDQAGRHSSFDKPPAGEKDAFAKSPMPPSPPIIQRQPAEQVPPATQETGTTTTGTSREETSELKEEININELARKVYTEVKRRLALEWERSRRI